jgi:hypothetical protein
VNKLAIQINIDENYVKTCLLPVVKKGKAIPVTGRGGPQSCGTFSLPHCLDNRLTNGGEAVSLMHQPPFTPRKIPGTHFYYRLRRSQGHCAAGRTRSIGKFIDLVSSSSNAVSNFLTPQ